MARTKKQLSKLKKRPVSPSGSIGSCASGRTEPVSSDSSFFGKEDHENTSYVSENNCLVDTSSEGEFNENCSESEISNFEDEEVNFECKK